MKICAVQNCEQNVNEEVSLVFCPAHEHEYQNADTPLIDRGAVKKDTGWNVLIYKKNKNQ